MTRTCPGCSTTLNNFDFYFCSACGTLLPQDLINNQNTFNFKSNISFMSYDPSVTLHSHYNKEPFYKDHKVFFISIFTGILVFLVIFYFYDSLSSFVKPKDIELAPLAVTTQTSDQKAVSIGKDYQLGDFTGLDYANYLPAQPLMYADFNDLSWLDNLNDSTFDQYGSLFEVFLQNNFALYVSNDESQNWILVFKVKNKDEVQKLLDLLTNKSFVYDFYSDYLYLSNTPELIADSVNSAQKKSLSLSLNPSFVTKVNSLPKLGQGRVLFFDKPKSLEYLKSVDVKDSKLIDVLSSISYNEIVITSSTN